MKKRKDSKNRVLKEGESERKDGIYQYRYTDKKGKRHSIYDKDLKKLRKKEEEIAKQLSLGIDTEKGNITVYNLVKSYIEIKKMMIKPTTMMTYNRALKQLGELEIGHRRIIDVKSSDAKRWAVELKEDGYSYNTINVMKVLVSCAFQMAIDDDALYKNPFGFQLRKVIANDTKKKKALTDDQYSRLLEFVNVDRVFKKYYSEIVFMYETGIRVSEFCGLTVKDIDLFKKEITINKQLNKTKAGVYYVSSPKSKCGYRKIPLSDEACRAIKNIILNRRCSAEMMIDGWCGFVLVRSDGTPKTCWNIEYSLRQIVEAYNKLNPDDPLPMITPHVLRHTFCTNKIKEGMNIKSVQYLMGHSKVQTTLDIYTSVNYDDVKEDFEKRTVG